MRLIAIKLCGSLKAATAITILALFGLPTACQADQAGPLNPKREIRVLFLGNSLTAANDLPAMVQAMAAASGVKLTYKAITQGGFNLEDHWNDRQSLPALA